MLKITLTSLCVDENQTQISAEVEMEGSYLEVAGEVTAIVKALKKDNLADHLFMGIAENYSKEEALKNLESAFKAKEIAEIAKDDRDKAAELLLQELLKKKEKRDE